MTLIMQIEYKSISIEFLMKTYSLFDQLYQRWTQRLGSLRA